MALPPQIWISYAVGTACLGLGINCFVAPKNEYPRFGLPLENPPSTAAVDPATSTTEKAPASSAAGTISPLIYLKGIREVSYGLALLILQHEREESALTTFFGLLSFAALGDGAVVWLNTTGSLRWKAFGHWGFFVLCAGWTWWRATQY